MRRIFSILLPLMMILSVLLACAPVSAAEAPDKAAPEVTATAEPVANIPSPMTSYNGLAEMLAAVPGINMKDCSRRCNRCHL